MGLQFQVTDVNKPLVSVKRIVEKGNVVHFGPEDKDNYIENRETKDRIELKPNGRGSYLMDVNFVGGERTLITVDSGAEENVCPWSWGEQFETRDPKVKRDFRNASGGAITHYGERRVLVESPF